MTRQSVRLAAILRATAIITIALINMSLAAGSAAFAQITVTNATFPVAGDTLKMAIDYSPSVINLVYTPPGFDLTWDLSSLQAAETRNFIYRPAAAGLVGGQVPGAELVMTSPPSPAEYYYNVTGTEIALQAYHGIAPYDVVSSQVFGYAPPLRERAAPLNFFDVRASSSGILKFLVPSDFPPALVAALPVRPDSLRYRVALNNIEAVDAYGTLIIPDGSYSVLRQKRTAYRETRLDGKIPPLGWLDLTDVALQAGFSGLGVDTTVTFDFYNDVEKTPIASVELNAAQNAAVQTLFKYSPSWVAHAGSAPGARVHLRQNQPNPFNPRTTIKYDLPTSGPVRLSVFDLAGRLVRTLVDGNMPEGSHESDWDGRDAAGREVGSGSYLARLEFGGKVETVRMGLIR
jgi:hypothetical protein